MICCTGDASAAFFFFLTDYTMENHRRNPDNNPSVSDQRVYFVSLRWWKNAQDLVPDGAAEGKTGKAAAAVYVATSASLYTVPLRLINTMFSSDLAFNLKREEGGVGVPGWGRAVEDDMSDVYPLQLRFSIPKETNSLSLKICKKDNTNELFKRACRIFGVDTKLLRIWDFSGHIKQYFLNGCNGFTKDYQKQSDLGVVVELQIYGLSDSLNKSWEPFGNESFGDLLRKLWAPGATPIAPRTFKAKLALFAPQFSGYNQHDSQLFCWMVFMRILISARESISLYKCLETFLTEEPLGPEDMWYCPGCKEHRQASKKLDHWRLHEILVVHLKSLRPPHKRETNQSIYALCYEQSSRKHGRRSLYCICPSWGVRPISVDKIKTSAGYLVVVLPYTAAVHILVLRDRIVRLKGKDHHHHHHHYLVPIPTLVFKALPSDHL
ncbi:hypothetical protein MLD38_008203 [Melastoma candidum]|uniref:Uncharacterized protein n=1 Tax=Melastoma candidum TaxID=119954 RepID=A0ACB9RTQ8_9MYRT|nr:hypothetical protein MLD38_008203 [Melastoma candidum]